MALSLVAVGQKITAALMNSFVVQINKTGLTQAIPGGYGSAGGAATILNNRVSFSGSNGIILDNVFNSQFNTYKIFLEEFSTAGTAHTVSMKFRAAGVDVAGTNYSQQQTVKNGASIVGSAVTGAAVWTVCAVPGNTQKTVEITVFKVLNAGYGKQILSRAFENGGAPAATDVEGQCGFTTAVDGLRFDFSAGTSNGSVDVYGYNA